MHRIAIVEYTRSAGGVERVLRGLAKAFLEMEEARDWDVTFLLAPRDSTFALLDWPEELRGPRVHVEWLAPVGRLGIAVDRIASTGGRQGGVSWRRAVMTSTRIARRFASPGLRFKWGDPSAQIRVASKRFDLIYLHYPFGVVAPTLDCAVVTTPADFNFKHFSRWWSPTRLRLEASANSWLKRSDYLIFSTRVMLDELARFYPSHVAKSTVVHLGVETDYASMDDAAKAQARKKLGVPEAFILLMGWLAPHKNQHVVVLALQELRRRGIEIPLVFAGPNTSHILDSTTVTIDVSYARKLRQLLDDAGLEVDRDYFVLGYVDDEAVRMLFSVATMFVYPSKYEGFGLSGLEAMVAGCPTVLSDIPPFREQLGVLGDVAWNFGPDDPVALADRLQEILATPSETMSRARHAGAMVRAHFSWQSTARGYLDVFERAIRTHRGVR